VNKNQFEVNKMVLEIYQCKKCNEIFEKEFAASDCGCTPICCDDPMELLQPKTADFTNEKHVPIIEKTDNGIKVIVGSTLHPMVDTHWITMIDVVDGNKLYRAFLKPGDKPEAEFPIHNTNVKAREYCNVHGLWSN
jgi:superoxide reductase